MASAPKYENRLDLITLDLLGNHRPISMMDLHLSQHAHYGQYLDRDNHKFQRHLYLSEPSCLSCHSSIGSLNLCALDQVFYSSRDICETGSLPQGCLRATLDPPLAPSRDTALFAADFDTCANLELEELAAVKVAVLYRAE